MLLSPLPPVPSLQFCSSFTGLYQLLPTQRFLGLWALVTANCLFGTAGPPPDSSLHISNASICLLCSFHRLYRFSYYTVVSTVVHLVEKFSSAGAFEVLGLAWLGFFVLGFRSDFPPYSNNNPSNQRADQFIMVTNVQYSSSGLEYPPPPPANTGLVSLLCLTT
jgi:hypothetical protein